MICKNCQDADIRGALQKEYYHDPHGTYYPRVRRKSNHAALWELKRTDSCQFCSFLHGTCKDPESFKESRNKHIYPAVNSGLSLLWIGYYWGDIFDKFGAIQLDQKDEITEQDGQFYQTPPLISCYDRIRGYISTCQFSHGVNGWSACQYSDAMPLLSRLKVLDCKTRNVVMAPSNCPYLALSYVWGAKPSSFDGLKYPSTIEDAITVTLRMGYQYLWVDQYCINQNSPEKMIHIQQMDRIYYNAEACIVAAAGDDYNHGLPGVKTPRNVQPSQCSVQIDGLNLLKHDRAPLDYNICKSKWWQRGWTFQELLFARRRIYFTENEVLVDCACCTIREGLPWEHEPNSDAKGFETGSVTYKSLSRYSWPISDLHTQLYKELIPAYTTRQLTHPTDIIEAFSGIFNSTDDLYHIWGIPVFNGLNPSSLTWFLYGLTWCVRSKTVEMKKSRRLGFPSWSWTGWYGNIDYLEIPPHTSKTKYNGKVWIERGSGSDFSIERFENVNLHSSAKPTIESSLQYIHLECCCLPIQIRWMNDGDFRLFIGRDRDFWLNPGLYSGTLRSDLDIAFGRGPQRVVDCCGLCLYDLDTMSAKELMRRESPFNRGTVDDYIPTISRCLVLVYNMGNHWERIGGFFFVNYISFTEACRLANEQEDVYETFPRPYNRSDVEEWWKSLTPKWHSFRLG